jgi:hypothetical protein
MLQLSIAAQAALQEFYREQEEAQDKLERISKVAESSEKLSTVQINDFTEDWQLSQFWYDEATIDRLATELLSYQSPDRHIQILCLSTPSVFTRLRQQRPDSPDIYLMEYDRRFSVYGPQYIFYDYNHPLEFDQQFLNRFDILLIDPPFLSEECFQKVWSTVSAVMRRDGAKLLWCTGRVMRPLLEQIGLHETSFQPKHGGGRLSNDFGCFANYEFNY